MSYKEQDYIDFIEDMGFAKKEFQEWQEQKASKQGLLSETAITLECRVGRNYEHINITPWLKNASEEDFKRLLAVENDDLMQEGDDNFDFVWDVVFDAATGDEEDDIEKWGIASIYMGEAITNIRSKMQDLRPIDFEKFVGTQTVNSADQPALI